MMGTRPDEMEDALDAAAAWLMAHDRGLSDAEARDFAAWLEASASNQEAWADAAGLWNSFDREPDDLLASLHAEALSARPSRLRWAPAWGMAAAAAIALSIGIGSWRLWEPAAVPDAMPQLATAKIYSAGASRTELALADGSHVVLDVGARIAVTESAARRDVALQAGKAFFKVAHDTSRPFVVASGDRTVTATGTAFSVARDPNGLSVVLEEGRVRIDVAGRPADEVDLIPGQEYRVEPGQQGFVRSINVTQAMNWRQSVLSLHDITVRDALAMMDHATPPRIVIGDAAVGNLRVSGRFRADDPAAFVDSLAALYPVRVTRLPSGQLKISSAGPRRRTGE
jgi:transmembrane sensor